MNMTWPYYTWDSKTLELVSDEGDKLMGNNNKPMQFSYADEAENYLQDNDIRGNVR